MPWVFGLVLKWHDNSELSPFGDASVIPWSEQNFSAGSWTAEQKFSQRLVVKGKERNILTLSGRLKNVFQRKTTGSCSKRDACSFLHTHATGDREDNVEWSGDTQEILIQKQASSTVPKVEDTDWRKKLEQSKGQPCDWSWNFLVYGGQDEEYRRVIIDIIPCVVVTCLETVCIHDYRCLCRQADGKRKPQLEVKSRKYSRNSC